MKSNLDFLIGVSIRKNTNTTDVFKILKFIWSEDDKICWVWGEISDFKTSIVSSYVKFAIFTESSISSEEFDFLSEQSEAINVATDINETITLIKILVWAESDCFNEERSFYHIVNNI